MVTLPALYAGVDGISPGTPLPPGTKILVVYVGATDLPDPPDARRLWTIDDCNLYLDPDSPFYGGPDLRILPVFVHDFASDPLLVAQNCADALLDMGWSDKLGRLVFLDLETYINAVFVTRVESALGRLGFRMGKYGSAAYVNQNPPVPGGTWMALLTRHRPAVLPPDAVGQQWAWNVGGWDLDEFSQFVYDNCGQGMRQARP